MTYNFNFKKDDGTFELPYRVIDILRDAGVIVEKDFE